MWQVTLAGQASRAATIRIDGEPDGP